MSFSNDPGTDPKDKWSDDQPLDEGGADDFLYEKESKVFHRPIFSDNLLRGIKSEFSRHGVGTYKQSSQSPSAFDEESHAIGLTSPSAHSERIRVRDSAIDKVKSKQKESREEEDRSDSSSPSHETSAKQPGLGTMGGLLRGEDHIRRKLERAELLSDRTIRDITARIMTQNNMSGSDLSDAVRSLVSAEVEDAVALILENERLKTDIRMSEQIASNNAPYQQLEERVDMLTLKVDKLIDSVHNRNTEVMKVVEHCEMMIKAIGNEDMITATSLKQKTDEQLSQLNKIDTRIREMRTARAEIPTTDSSITGGSSVKPVSLGGGAVFRRKIDE